MHNNAASFSIRTILCENTNIPFRKNYWKLGNMNARFWKNIWNNNNICLGQFSKFCLRQQLFTFKEFYMETRLSNIFNYKHHDSGKGHSRKPLYSSTSHIQIENNPSSFYRQLNFALLLTFKLILLWLYFGKSCKTTLFRKPTKVCQNTPTSYQ